MNLVGLEIERKTDVLALTAFLLSALTAVYQFGIFVIGPNATLLMPDSVTLYRLGGKSGVAYASAVASMTIANTSSATEPLLVKMEKVELVVDGKEVSWNWYGQTESTITIGEKKLEGVKAIGPFIVDTKKIQSSLVVFAPQARACGAVPKCDPNDNFVAWPAFADALQASMQRGGSDLAIRFSAEFGNHHTVQVVCNVPIHPNQLALMADDGYVTEQCIPGSK